MDELHEFVFLTNYIPETPDAHELHSTNAGFSRLHARKYRIFTNYIPETLDSHNRISEILDSYDCIPEILDSHKN